ncbi:MAG: helix-turn-helix transcriptional regulator [Cytophagales bacterium]|nr:helix-turn-helix transcriptional regulator [Armatimonadota bacterium]
MAPGSTEESVSGNGRSAKTSKGKKGKEDTPNSTAGTEGKNGPLLRQVATDLASLSENLGRLRADVDTLKGLSVPPTAGRGKKGASAGHTPTKRRSGSVTAGLLAALADEPEVAVALAVPGVDSGDKQDTSFVLAPDLSALLSVDTAQVAKLGYAFSSAPKVSLLRLLLTGGEQTAAQLGASSGLTTGSLYHHLRELVHAEVAHSSSRNHFALTPLGRRAALILLALSTDDGR